MSIVAGIVITIIGGLFVHEHRARAPQIHKKIILFAQKLHVKGAVERMARNSGCMLQDCYLEFLDNSSGGDLTKLIIALSAVQAAIISDFNYYIELIPRSLRIAAVFLIGALAITSIAAFYQSNTISEEAVDPLFHPSTLHVDASTQLQTKEIQAPVTKSRASRLSTSIEGIDKDVSAAAGTSGKILEDAVDQSLQSSTMPVEEGWGARGAAFLAGTQPEKAQVPITMSRLIIDASRLSTSIEEIDKEVATAAGISGQQVVSFTNNHYFTRSGEASVNTEYRVDTARIGKATSVGAYSGSSYDALGPNFSGVTITRRYMSDPALHTFGSTYSGFDSSSISGSLRSALQSSANQWLSNSSISWEEISEQEHYFVYYFYGHGRPVSTMGAIDNVLASSSGIMEGGILTNSLGGETAGGIQVKHLFEAALPAQAPTLSSYSCDYYCTYNYEISSSGSGQISNEYADVADWSEPSTVAVDPARSAMDKSRETLPWTTSTGALAATAWKHAVDNWNYLPKPLSFAENSLGSIVGILESNDLQSTFLDPIRYALSAVLQMLVIVVLTVYLLGKVRRIVLMSSAVNINLRGYKHVRQT